MVAPEQHFFFKLVTSKSTSARCHWQPEPEEGQMERAGPGTAVFLQPLRHYPVTASGPPLGVHPAGPGSGRSSRWTTAAQALPCQCSGTSGSTGNLPVPVRYTGTGTYY